MATIQVKNIPDDVHQTMRTRAAQSGMSLQEYLLARLTADARQPTLEDVLNDAGSRTGGSIPIAEAVRLIRADRDAR